MARDWKFCIYKVEELYYPSSENKGADQLRSYREADLRLCFRLCRLLVFPCGGSFKSFTEEMFRSADCFRRTPAHLSTVLHNFCSLRKQNNFVEWFSVNFVLSNISFR